MIVKYLKGGSWVYIDGVQCVENSAILPLELAEQFDNEVKEGKRIDLTSHTESMDSYAYEKLKNEEIERKAFTIAREKCECDEVEAENNISADLVKKDFVTCVVLIHMNKHDSAEPVTLMLATNQNVYLMNDKGQTIERLV
jgi:hypothetical protein